MHLLLLKVLSLLIIQILELNGALVLLKSMAKQQYKFANFFKNDKLLNNRNWFLAPALGFEFLVLLIFLTSQLLIWDLADILFGSKEFTMPPEKRRRGPTREGSSYSSFDESRFRFEIHDKRFTNALLKRNFIQEQGLILKEDEYPEICS